MNEICAACGFCKSVDAEQWNLLPTMWVPGEGPVRYDGSQADAVVVTNTPKMEDFGTGLHMSDAPRQWLARILQSLQMKFVVDAAVRCIGRDKAPSAKTYEQCHPHWTRTVAQARPKLVICIGHQAAKVVTQLKTLTMAQLRDGVWPLKGCDYETQVVCMEDPASHSAYQLSSRGGKDLRPGYEDAVARISAIRSGQYVQAKIEYELVRDPAGITAAAKEINHEASSRGDGVLSHDTELALPEVCLWHPRNKLLTVGVGGCSQPSDVDSKRPQHYRQWVFEVRDWAESSIERLYREVFANKVVVGTNVKVEIQAAYRFANKLKLQTVIRRIHDGMFLSYIQDQSKWGNGLESQGIRFCGIDAYKSRVNGEFDKVRQLIKPVARTPASTYPARFAARAQQILDYYNQDQLAIPQADDNLHYGHLERDFLNYYQAMDVWVQSRVWHEHLAEVYANLPPNLKAIYDLMIGATWALAEVERCGMPVDLDRMELERTKLRNEADRIQTWLDRHPFTLAAGLTDGLNTNSWKQTDAVVKSSATHVAYVSRATEAARVDKRELKRQCGPEAGKTAKQKFWTAFSALRYKRNRLSKFLDPYCEHQLYGWVYTTFSLTRSEGSAVLADAKEGSGGIESGRVASHDDSFHTIPKDDMTIRRCFPGRRPSHLPSRPGSYMCLEADFSAAEPVVLGLFTKCRSYLKVFYKKFHSPRAWDSDLYQYIATRFWKIEDPEVFWLKNEYGDLVNPKAVKLRKVAKVLVLATTYLQTPRSAAETYGVSEEEAEAFITWFWREHPEILQAVSKVIYDVTLGRMIVTPSGRQSSFELLGFYNYDPDEHDGIPFHELIEILNIRSPDDHAIRKAWNFLIQATASDCCIAQLVRLHGILEKQKPDWFFLCNVVHDSIWALVHELFVEKGVRLLRSVMSDPRTYLRYHYKLDFPDPAEAILLNSEESVGPTRGDMRGAT